MQILDGLLDTLADGRQLIRVKTPLAASLLPGQCLADNTHCFPVLRHDARAQTVDIVAPVDSVQGESSWQLAGQALTLNIQQRLRFVTHNDGIFIALHFLFNQSSLDRQRVSVIAQFDRALPFRPCPSRHYFPNLPAHVIAALPLLEDWGVFNRVIHADAVGCFDGSLAQLRMLMPLAEQEIVLP